MDVTARWGEKKRRTQIFKHTNYQNVIIYISSHFTTWRNIRRYCDWYHHVQPCAMIINSSDTIASRHHHTRSNNYVQQNSHDCWCINVWKWEMTSLENAIYASKESCVPKHTICCNMFHKCHCSVWLVLKPSLKLADEVCDYKL